MPKIEILVLKAEFDDFEIKESVHVNVNFHVERDNDFVFLANSSDNPVQDPYSIVE